MEKEAGRDFERLFEEMRVCKQNIRLVERVLLAQAGIYERNDNNTALFISLPFCPTKCAYCSFITAPIDKTRHFVNDYLACLKKELSACENLLGNIRSIYIGGGTPFALEREEIREVLEAVKPYKEKFPCAEYTVEAGRPDTFTEEKLALLKEYGVDRICINPQTFSNEVLKNIGRKHTVEDFYKAYEMSKKYGFIVNIDLIAGLEGESADGFSKGVQKAIDLDADNITVHCLSLKSGAKLKEETAFLEKDGISEMIGISRELLSKAGYEPYYMYRQKYQAGNNENAGWTKTGKACVYNIDVMEETAHNLAVGANAVSKRVWTAENRIERLGSPKDLKTYIENIEKIIREKTEFFK
jgi:oxygen-independent coproporphyrinogen-3 oxidase